MDYEMSPLDLEDSLTEFTLAEIVELENIFKDIGEESLGQEFCEDVALSFSCSDNRAGKSTITWKQVQSWFENRQVTSSRPALKLLKNTPDTAITSSEFERFPMPKASKKRKFKTGKKVDLSELAFEAKSSKDYAWYDVASFLTYRVLSTGELEVRVRYAGFGKGEDEWVSVKRAVRERSIPLEPSECQRVRVGDLVLCFQERQNHAVYCDAHVLEIQRRLHDMKGCRCIFVVRYDHDYSEEKVGLGRICCRPNQDDFQAELSFLERSE